MTIRWLARSWADDFVAGFEHRDDAERSCTPTRPGSSSSGAMPLALVPPRGSENRRRSGFSSFTHMCGKTRAGRFWLRRVTEAERMRAKLKDVKVEPKRRRHQPMPVQGLWLASVVRGHFAYYDVPGSSDAITAFGYQVARHWIKALRRRSQRTRLTWAPMTRYVRHWLPPARLQHPFPSVRFDANTRGRSPVR